MTKLVDTKNMLKGYYAFHYAIRADLDSLMQYVQLSPQKRAELRGRFATWFKHAARMAKLQRDSSAAYFYPKLRPFVKDAENFFSFLMDKHKALDELAEKIHQELAKTGDDAELLRMLEAYRTQVLEYIEQHETILAPAILENFTPEAFKKLQKEGAAFFSFADAKVLLPWMMHRLQPDAKQALINDAAQFPVNLLYKYWMEPSYRKNYPSWNPDAKSATY